MLILLNVDCFSVKKNMRQWRVASDSRNVFHFLSNMTVKSSNPLFYLFFLEFINKLR